MARNQNQTANVVVTLDGKQAEKMLEVLKTKSSDLRAELKTLNDQRLTTGLTGQEAQRFDALRKELLETRRVSREVAKQVKDVDDVIRNLSTAPIKAIKDSIKTVEAQMNRLDRSTERYAEKQNQLNVLRQELDRITESAKGSQKSFIDIDSALSNIKTLSLEQLQKIALQLKENLKSIQPGTEQFIKSSERLRLVTARMEELRNVIRGVSIEIKSINPMDVVKDMGSYSSKEIKEASSAFKEMRENIPTSEIDKIKELDKYIELLDTHLKELDGKKAKDVSEGLGKIAEKAKNAEDPIINIERLIKRLNKQSTGQLRKAINQLENELSKLSPETQEFVTKSKQLDKIKNRFNELNGVVKKTTSAFDQIGNTVKRLASYVLVYAGFNELTAGLRKMYNANVALSDQLADIQKTTGLMGQDLADLSNSILRIDTRTPVEQLNALAVAAGKLGISAKEDVLEFVKAGNIINVALGEDLGEDAIRSLAKLNDILGITKEMGIEKGLLATGSAINELGQSSTANEGYLVDFAQRLGGIAAQTNLTMQQVLALGSVTDQLGQSSEVSATALNKFVTTLVSKTGQVAKAVGIPLQELQQALDRSTWEGMMMVFEKLSGKGGLAAIAPLMGDLGSDGARLNAVISALTDDTSRLTRELGIANQAFAEGTSVVNEYDAKNNNLAASIQKIGKNIKQWFMGTGIIDFLYRGSSFIEKITRGTDSAQEAFKKSVSSVRSLQREIVPLLQEYEQLKDSEAADEQERLKTIMAQIATAIPSAVSAMDQYGNILSINTDRAYAFIEAQKLIMQQNNKDLIEETKKTISSLEYEYAIAAKQVKEIQQKGSFTATRYVPTARGPMEAQEYSVTDPAKIKAAQQAYVTLNAELEKQRAILGQLTGDYLNEDLERIKKLKEASEDKNNKPTSTGEDPKDVLKRQIEAIDLWLQKKKNALMEARQMETDINNENYISEKEYQDAILALELQALEKRLALQGLEQKEIEEIRGRILEIRQRMIDDSIKIQQEIQKILLDADPVKKENVEYEERLKALNLFGIARENMTKDQLEALRILEEKHKDDLLDIQDKLDKELKEKKEKEFRRSIKNQFGMEYEEWNDSRFMDVNNKQTALDINSDLETMFEYEKFNKQMEIHKERMAILQEELDMRKQIGADTADVLNRMSELEWDMAQDSVEHIKYMVDKFKDYGSQIGETLGNLLMKQEGALQSLYDVLVDIAFKELEVLANKAIYKLGITGAETVGEATMKSYATADSIATFGASGAARAAVLAALISAAMATAKAAVKAALKGQEKDTQTSSGGSGQRVIKTGYSVGGHTGDGPTLEVAGLVHRGEYVVPKWQMQDPVSFDYVRALETIRQTRTRMNPLPVRHGYAEGGPVSTPVSPAYDDTELKQTLNAMNRLLIKLDRQGVRTEFNISRLNDVQQSYNTSRSRGTLNG